MKRTTHLVLKDSESSGEHNSRAKQGTLKVFCNQNGLSYGKMMRSVNMGKITESRSSSTSNTLHWEIQSYG